MAGVGGAIVANVTNLLPPVLFMTVASMLYARYGGAASVKAGLEMVRYAVAAMIVAIAIKLVDKSHLLDMKYVPVIVISFLVLTLTKIHPALVIVGAAVYGGLLKIGANQHSPVRGRIAQERASFERADVGTMRSETTGVSWFTLIL